MTVDHDHKTGNLQGLLCNGCNKGLGLFKDNPEILNKAKEYLELCRKEN
ncbi:MAG: endonuclease VII domain-containing protein [Chitinophagales bacterium]|nr:endonuclease VII domain-containing protein [Chitinophagales bacterium]